MKRTAIFLLALGFCALPLKAQVLAEDHPQVATIQNEDFYIFVDKNANTLSLRSFSQPNLVLHEYRAISGLNSGDKMVEGDKKTPEGIYIIDAHVPQSMIVRSLHGTSGVSLDYPNPVDRINRQTGYGIWIHGVVSEDRLDRRFDTRGCVAMGNDEIDQLKQWVSPMQTVVVIVDQELENVPLGYVPTPNVLSKRLDEWAQAWSSRDNEAYMRFYHPDFYSRRMNYEQWKNYKGGLKDRYQFIDVGIENLKVFRHSKYWMTQFTQHYTSDNFSSKTFKRIYWVGPEDNLQILAEKSVEVNRRPVVRSPE